jgi:hypothetical protein
MGLSETADKLVRNLPKEGEERSQEATDTNLFWLPQWKEENMPHTYMSLSYDINQYIKCLITYDF